MKTFSSFRSLAVTVATLAACAGTVAQPATTLRCDVSKRCDGFVQNCTTDPLFLNVELNPAAETVTIDGVAKTAVFSKDGKATFHWNKFRVELDKFEWSAMLTSADEVRFGKCVAVRPAW
ncbi:hypothetical protein ABIC83_002448 [Roseateles asaccharophilus]|uniref:hypothetical protein n=1 Tax=Roseateles asaccharophilus TaxID=582607 RepID=UPI0038363CD6